MYLPGEDRRSRQVACQVYRVRMKLDAQQHLERLNLYGMVQGLRYVVRLNDLKTAQHLRPRLARVLRRPDNLAKPLRGDLKELFEISGLWVRARTTKRSDAA